MEDNACGFAGPQNFILFDIQGVAQFMAEHDCYDEWAHVACIALVSQCPLAVLGRFLHLEPEVTKELKRKSVKFPILRAHTLPCKPTMCPCYPKFIDETD